MIELSVVIATFNRSAMLMRCLDALENQSLTRDSYEILVIDDNSPDDTSDRIVAYRAVRYFRQPANAGPGAARNVGIRNALGKWVLFLDDDILVAPNTLELHLDARREHPEQNVAIMGWTRVAADVNVTPLMRHLLESGKSPLIDSRVIANPNDVPFEYFQTNTSIARSFLQAYGLFDEDIRYAYGDDTELAYRLHQHGLVLMFRPDIVVDHYGLFSYQYARRRAQLAGKTAIQLHRKHPEWIDIRFLNFGPKARMSIQGKRWLAARVLDPLLLTADARQWDVPALGHACTFSLNVHQLGSMLDTARAEHLVP